MDIKEICILIDNNYQTFLKEFNKAVAPINPAGRFTIAEMNIIGIKSLLSQRPSFKVSGNTLRAISDAGVDISDIAVGDIVGPSSTGVHLEAYNYLLSQANKMIKDSILISFGVNPDTSIWTDEEIADSMYETSVMSRRSEKEIKEEYRQMLKLTDYDTLSNLLDAIESGAYNLSSEQEEYRNQLNEVLLNIKDGRFSNGLTLKDASEKFAGIEFVEIENYFPLLRYKTYLTAQNHLS